MRAITTSPYDGVLLVLIHSLYAYITDSHFTLRKSEHRRVSGELRNMMWIWGDSERVRDRRWLIIDDD